MLATRDESLSLSLCRAKTKATSLLTGNRYHPPTRRVNLLSGRSAIHVPPTPSSTPPSFSGLIIGEPINWVVPLFTKKKKKGRKKNHQGQRGHTTTTTTARRPKTEPNGPEFGIDPVTSILNTPIEPTTPSLSLSLAREKKGGNLGRAWVSSQLFSSWILLFPRWMTDQIFREGYIFNSYILDVETRWHVFSGEEDEEEEWSSII